MALGSAASFGFNITFSRIAALSGVPGPTLVTWRVLAMMALGIAVGLVLRADFRIPRGERGPMVVLGLATAGCGLCYLSSVAFIPVTVAAVLFYTFPVLIVLASPFVEGGRIGGGLMAIALLAFCGVVLVVGPAFGDLDPIGLLLAAGASLSAVAQFFAAVRCPRTGTAAKVVWLQLMVLPVAALSALATGGLGGPGTLLLAPWSVAFNVFGFVLGFVLQLMALSRVTAVAGGLAFCAEPVVASLTSAAVLGETLMPVQYMGGAMVIAAIVANVLRDRRRSRLALTPEPAA
ncbi:EamA family transporter [Alsobacter sp. SYSU M60028]|uniref:EamA family transporter n=1 Tax=Alsobacter ponti TaxID=2962936 RepID=A0ABT1LIA7_9HYPH|nr:EamA family transporter [Alsobacter ponti]MCP8940686.1 EamA family transporter [Alsobacter ponti]